MRNSVVLFFLIGILLPVVHGELQATQRKFFPKKPRSTILEYLAARPNKFTILATAASTVPGLLDTLNDTSASLTLFPPTDKAFAELAALLVPDAELSLKDKAGIATALVEAIAPLADVAAAGNPTLATILAYHLLPEGFSFAQLEKKGSVVTAQKDSLMFAKGAVIDADDSRPNPVPRPRDVQLKNGFAHVIDTVLLPFNLEEILQGLAGTPAGEIDIAEAEDIPNAIIPDPRPTILGYLASLPDEFGILARAAALIDGLPDTLDTPSARLTLFAPNDKAFTDLANLLVPGGNFKAKDKDGVLAALGEAIAPLENLKSADFATLGSILSYHLVTEALPFQELKARRKIATAEGTSLRIKKKTVRDKDRSRKNAKAVRRNVFTRNGWVHVINSVLLPFDLNDVAAEAASA